jgi:hypothetical protein
MERREREAAGMVTAVSEPLQIGEVIILPSYQDAGDAYRFQVVRQLTHAEFVAQMQENRKQPGHAAISTDMVGSIALPPPKTRTGPPRINGSFTRWSQSDDDAD